MRAIICWSWLQTNIRLPPALYVIWFFGNAAITSRVDRGKLWYIFFFQDFCIFCIQYLGRLWYAESFNEPQLQLNDIGFPQSWVLLITTLWGKATCDNFSRNRGKLSHHIELREKWYPNSI